MDTKVKTCCGFHSEKECSLEEFVYLVSYMVIHISEVFVHLEDWIAWIQAY